MSFGLNILADDGTPVLDIQHPVLEVCERGTTRLLINGQLDSFFSSPEGNYDTYYEVFRNKFSFGGLPIYGAMTSDRAWGLSEGVAFPDLRLPSGGGLKDTLFYRPGTTPIKFSTEVVLDGLDPVLPRGVLGMIDQPSIPFACAREATPRSYSDTHGMQVFRDDGTLLFDSRADHLPIRHAFVFPKSLMDVIIDGTTPVVNVSLPEPMPNAWIAAPIFVPYQLEFRRKWAGKWEYYESHLQFSQPDPNTIRFERATQLIKTYQRTPYTYTHDAIFYLARSAPPVT